MKTSFFKHAFIVTLTLLCQPLFSEMVPFVIPADVHPDSQIAMEWQPLTEQDRLSAAGHFVNRSGKRVRLWGVNLTFEANFPEHKDAERVAKRMAAFGVNTVRCHHMDTMQWPRGIGDQNGKDLHPEAMDRLDYFINELAKHGIYTNMNLHVGKKHSVTLGLPESPTDYDKMVNIFTPELVEAQKDYARQLLTHKNPYRGNIEYAKDYAVAIVEITNENSLFMWGAENTLRTLPPFYAGILQKQYNQWLADKYKTQAALAAGWTKDSQPTGENLLKNATLTDAEKKTQSWNIEQHAGAKASAEITACDGRPALRMHSLQKGTADWHLQINQGPLKLTKDQIYTVEFDYAAPTSRTLHISVLQAHDPWKNMGLYQPVTAEPKWNTFRTTFIAADNDDNVRLSFSFGSDDQEFYLANVKLYSGARYNLADEESLEKQTVRLFGQIESRQRKTDRMVFLAETEKTYFDAMKSFIQKDLGCKAMVTGTIVFGPLGLYAQSDMDFIDAHAYWQHPRFPNKSWDMSDWLVDQKAMSDDPEQGTLYELAAQRMQGKPFTVTEYNHPAPLDSQAECVPMIASFAAAQDWDGVWLYTYSHTTNWDRQHLNSFFDIDTNPAKWGFMIAGTFLFRESYFPPNKIKTVHSFAKSDTPLLKSLAQSHLQHDRNMLAGFEKERQDYIRTVMMQTFEPVENEVTRLYKEVPLEYYPILWWEGGMYLMKNCNAYVTLGNMASVGDTFKYGCQFHIEHPASASLTLTPLDGKDLHQSRKILLTACGKCENTQMKFSEDRRTVGTHWGQAPVLIEPIEGEIVLPSAPTGVKTTCKVLKADGTVSKTFDCPDNRLELKAEYGTMWYMVERTEK